MTITLDTDNKVITLHASVNILKLIDTLDTLGIDMEEWTIIPKTEIQTVTTPCTRPHYDNNWNRPYTNPINNDPWAQPWKITYHNGTGHPDFPFYKDNLTSSATIPKL